MTFQERFVHLLATAALQVPSPVMRVLVSLPLWSPVMKEFLCPYHYDPQQSKNSGVPTIMIPSNRTLVSLPLRKLAQLLDFGTTICMSSLGHHSKPQLLLAVWDFLGNCTLSSLSLLSEQYEAETIVKIAPQLSPASLPAVELRLWYAEIVKLFTISLVTDTG